MELLQIDRVGVFRSDYKPHASKEFFNGYSWAYFIAFSIYQWLVAAGGRDSNSRYSRAGLYGDTFYSSYMGA